MASGKEDKVKGAANKAAGKVKEAAGKATGSGKTEAKGKAQQAKGELQKRQGRCQGELKEEKVTLNTHHSQPEPMAPVVVFGTLCDLAHYLGPLFRA